MLDNVALDCGSQPWMENYLGNLKNADSWFSLTLTGLEWDLGHGIFKTLQLILMYSQVLETLV